MATPEEDAAVIGAAVNELLWWGTRSARRRHLRLPSGSSVDAWLLRAIATAEQIRPGDLAAMQGVDKSTVTPQLRRLESAGYITRRPDPDDRRSHVVILTETGRATVAELSVKMGAVLVPVLASWSEQDRRTLGVLLTRLGVGLQAETSGPEPSPAG